MSESEFWEVFHNECRKASIEPTYDNSAWSRMQNYICRMTEDASRSARRPFVGTAVFVKRGDKFLLGRRKGAHGSGTWALPGGHLEFGETFEACCCREVAEETGLKISNVRPVHFGNDLFDAGKQGKHYVTLFFVADSLAGEPVNVEPEKCEGWHWLPLRDFPSPMFAPLDSIIQRVRIDPKFAERIESI